MNRVNFIVLSIAALVVSISAAQQPTSIADKIEHITPRISVQQQQQLQQLAMQEAYPNRLPFLDSLFNIPIQTLRAVNDLIQGIAGSVVSIQENTLPLRKPQRKDFE
ncbi:hypothetical protein PVAND_010301 [Polypedilum vanderplanki]|uniref:Uncharacterized protein n=1 Tax=Polypedilum vanderplanki TaxID=319348 RepID=A0A9J6CG83_POLVA|nr:hypothetical protein PVAND_010301 [Polypedilum vanderplanki]